MAYETGKTLKIKSKKVYDGLTSLSDQTNDLFCNFMDRMDPFTV